MNRLCALHLRGSSYVIGALQAKTKETATKILREAKQQSIHTHLRLETGRWFAKMIRITDPLLNVRITRKEIPTYPLDTFVRLGMNVLKEHKVLEITYESYPLYEHPPWSRSNFLNVFHSQLPFKKKEDKEENKKKCQEILDERRKKFKPILEVYTDGAVVEERGAAGVYICDGNGELFATHSQPAGIICSSFRAEMAAIRNGLALLNEKSEIFKEKRNVLLVSDSASALREIEKGNFSQKTRLGNWIWGLIMTLNQKKNLNIIFQHVFSHCGIKGNEHADKLASEKVSENDDSSLLEQKKTAN
eukprot:TRINITY_DN11119_c0_g1_i3.p1 TRINITY_DN11119_c0_g1~~TRINITY_DN11119_c0_g1_i3.p1  ORF type:complete len:304 (+),score=24.12 TRINITY_DN11119_c0_g1_i3:835-1746(+)